jgi:prolipoprotein diacylglyceryltransferase
VITVTIDPVIVSFGHLALRWYGLIVAVAILIGARVAAAEAKRRGLLVLAAGLPLLVRLCRRRSPLTGAVAH